MIEFRPALLTSLKHYSREKFTADLMAGIIVGIVALRENAVIFCRQEYIIEKTLPVMVSLPGKGMQQDVGGGLLDVLPVGRIP